MDLAHGSTRRRGADRGENAKSLQTGPRACQDTSRRRPLTDLATTRIRRRRETDKLEEREERQNPWAASPQTKWRST